MIILLDTSSAVCSLTFVDSERKQNYKWQSDRGLAKGLLAFIDEKLKLNNKTWSDVSALGIYKGPGSFTGLRIGITVFNTIADSNKIPIVGCSGDKWQDEAVDKIKSGANDKMVLPFYGREARITQPRK